MESPILYIYPSSGCRSKPASRALPVAWRLSCWESIVVLPPVVRKVLLHLLGSPLYENMRIQEESLPTFCIIIRHTPTLENVSLHFRETRERPRTSVYFVSLLRTFTCMNSSFERIFSKRSMCVRFFLQTFVASFKTFSSRETIGKPFKSRYAAIQVTVSSGNSMQISLDLGNG